VDTYRTAFAYVFEGSAAFKDASNPVGIKVEKEIAGQELHLTDHSGNRTLVMFDHGDEVVVNSGEQGVRFLLVSGKPLKEPVAWHGPIVMNTKDEIRQALHDLNSGNFIAGNSEKR